MKLSIAGTIIAILLISACNSQSRAEDAPAVLVKPDEAVRAELLSAVRRSLNDRPVTLADSALTSSSWLTIERKSHRSLEGRPATGRQMEPPERFRLVQSDDQCVLIHLNSGDRMTLNRATCEPEAGS